MGVTLSKDDLRRALEHAVRRADSGDVPQEWVERTQHMAECPSKTYIAVLASALLARAAYGDAIDPRAIKRGSGPRGFSARSSVGVLAESARDFGYDLGATGPEPLNNQPWFHSDRVDRIPLDAVRAQTRGYLRSMKAYLKEADRLTKEEAEGALAALIVERRKVAETKADTARDELQAAGATLQQVAEVAQSFAAADSEGGKRGQALVAAALDCAFPRVELGAINDPDAFDVVAFRQNGDLIPTPVVQVKQKPVKDDVARRLAEAASDAGANAALLVAISPSQESLDDQVVAQHGAEVGIALAVVTHAASLLNELAVFSSVSAGEIASRFPARYETRLREIEVRAESADEWRELVEELLG